MGYLSFSFLFFSFLFFSFLFFLFFSFLFFFFYQEMEVNWLYHSLSMVNQLTPPLLLYLYYNFAYSKEYVSLMVLFSYSPILNPYSINYSLKKKQKQKKV